MVVGHSVAAAIATVYAARYRVRGVVNVDQWLQVEPAVRLAQSLAGQIRGAGFAAVWEPFEASMHIELLPAEVQELLRSGRNLRQDLITGYWRELLGLARRTHWPVAGRRARGQGALPVHRRSPGRARIPGLARSHASAGQRHGVAEQRSFPAAGLSQALRRMPGGHRPVGPDVRIVRR